MVHELLERAAREQGERVAAIDGERELSYAELEERASALAGTLAAAGVAPGDRVGLLQEKSLEALVAIYGVLKAGAAYVPLDDQAPLRRLSYIVRDAGIRCLIASPGTADVCRGMLAEGVPLQTIVGADGEGEGARWIAWSEVAERAADPPALAADPERLAYVLYTSGSTGEPKGVMLSHANCLAFVRWAAGEVEVGPADRLSSHAPFHFDLSTFDLFAAAHGGATVVLVPRELSVFPVMLARFIAERGITVWYSVPSVLTALVLRGELSSTPLPALRAVIFAGEVFPTKYLGRLMELVPHARYLNFYGPTETNVCTWYEARSADLAAEALPIGRPLPEVSALVLREDGSEAAEGEQGELVIGGPTVMHGYWGDPERSARALSVRDGERWYRTGDLVSRRADGELLFAGRRDMQVKTRGYRVELGEVEAALSAIEDVVEAAVVAVPDETITNRLKAFVVAGDGADAAALARLCAKRLPRHMIPDEIELRPELPKLSTGKIDRRALR
jgi:amino acid adenylation domain-containing protein